MSNGQEGGRAEARDEQAGEREQKIEASLPAASSFTSRLSGTAGVWGKWLLNSASGFVAELGAESVSTKALHSRRRKPNLLSIDKPVSALGS